MINCIKKIYLAAIALTVLLFSATSLADTRVTYLHNDLLGSPIASSDENGNLLWRQYYLPFGSEIEKIEAQTDNDVNYTGHQRDDESGLTYMQARYYDPVIGRFYSNDPVGFTGEVDTFNRYSYVANNPYKYTDPTGEIKLIVTGFKVLKKTIKSKGDFGGALKSEAGDIVDNVMTLADGKLDLNDVMAIVDLATGIDAGDVKSGLKAAENLRDSFGGAVGGRAAVVTGGFNKKTGQVAAGRNCGGGSGGNCAEDTVVEALGGNAKDVVFTKAIRPRTGKEKSICQNCQNRFGKDSFPKDAKLD